MSVQKSYECDLCDKPASIGGATMIWEYDCSGMPSATHSLQEVANGLIDVEGNKPRDPTHICNNCLNAILSAFENK